MTSVENEPIICTSCDSENTQYTGRQWIDEDTCIEMWACLECGAILSVIDGRVPPERTWKSWWEQD